MLYTLHTGYSGGNGNLAMGTPSGGGTFYDSPGKLDTVLYDPFDPRGYKEVENAGSNSWSDVGKSLVLSGVNALANKYLTKEDSKRGTITTYQLGSSGEIVERTRLNKRQEGQNTIPALNTGLIVGLGFIFIVLILFLVKRG